MTIKFSAIVNVTDDNVNHWNVVITAKASDREHMFEYSYARNNWTAAEAGAEALLVVVDRVNRGSI